MEEGGDDDGFSAKGIGSTRIKMWDTAVPPDREGCTAKPLTLDSGHQQHC